MVLDYKLDIYNNILYIRQENGNTRIEPINDFVARIVFSKNEFLQNIFLENQSFIIDSDFKRKKTQWQIKEEDSFIEFFSNQILIKIDKNNTSISYYNKKTNKLIFKESDKNPKVLEEIDVMKTKSGKNAESHMSKDGLRVNVDIQYEFDRKAYHTKLNFEFQENEGIYGLGSHEEGNFNLRGKNQYLYQQNMKMCIPFFYSTNNYGILMDTNSIFTFHDDQYGSYLWSDVNSKLDYYFIYGNDYSDVISQYRDLTGKVPMLPKYAFGYVQSKERYKTSEEIINVAKEYRKRNIPLDLIVLDWMSWSGNLWGEKIVDKERFPSLKKLVDTLHSMNIKLMMSIWPNMASGGSNHKELSLNGLLLLNNSTYNAYKEEARDMYFKHANEGLFLDGEGVDSWWCDCTEPFEADWKGEIKPEPEERYMINSTEFKKYIDPELTNIFSLLHSKGIYENQRKITNKKRVLNLTRSAYAGQQKYGTISWSGDTSASFDTLKKQIPDGLNFVATGCPYFTVDIGGFFSKSDPIPHWFYAGEYEEGCKDPSYVQLYIRWFQYGTFLPMFRSHGTDTPREVWQFGEKDSVAYETLKKFIEIRYKLIPYIYSLAAMITFENYSMMRGLPLDFPEDIKTHNIKDQYMFGTFMVCPVVEKDSYKRNVYLPENECWYDFWTNDLYEGGYEIEVKTPITEMPLFIKGGSIIPMSKIAMSTSEISNHIIDILIYPGKNCEFILYEDEGDGYGYEQGEFATIKFEYDDKKNQVKINKIHGEYDGMTINREFNIINILIGTIKSINYCGENIIVQI